MLLELASASQNASPTDFNSLLFSILSRSDLLELTMRSKIQADLCHINVLLSATDFRIFPPDSELGFNVKTKSRNRGHGKRQDVKAKRWRQKDKANYSTLKPSSSSCSSSLRSPAHEPRPRPRDQTAARTGSRTRRFRPGGSPPAEPNSSKHSAPAIGNRFCA